MKLLILIAAGSFLVGFASGVFLAARALGARVKRTGAEREWFALTTKLRGGQ